MGWKYVLTYIAGFLLGGSAFHWYEYGFRRAGFLGILSVITLALAIREARKERAKKKRKYW